MSVHLNKDSATQSIHTAQDIEAHKQLQYFDFVVPVAITLRSAGDMSGHSAEALKRRVDMFRQYCRDIDLWSRNYVLMQQVHKKRIKILTPQNFSTPCHATDGIISMSSLHSLAITVADCLPIYIAVPTHGLIGLLHSGRRSTGILTRALWILCRRYRIPPSNIHLLFGPSIRSCCYEVGKSIALTYRRRWTKEAVVERDGKYFIDMIYANKRIASYFDVLQVSVVDDCTHCNTDYHSHRRRDTDGTERMLALISPTR